VKPLKRIFSLVPDCHVPTGYYRLLWKRHIYDGIRPLVDKLLLPENLDFSWALLGDATALRDQEKHRATTSDQLWEQIQTAHESGGLDAVISYCYSHDLELELVKRVIKIGVPWVNFYCDSTHMFEKVEALARVVSLNWFPESAAVERYRALGVPSLHAAYALNPDFLPDLVSRSPQIPVAFIGLPTSNRITQLGWLRMFGCGVAVRGHGWVGDTANPFYNPTPKSQRAMRALFSRGLGEKILRRFFWRFVRSQARGPLDDARFFEFVSQCRVVLGLNQGKDEQGRFSSYLKFRDVEFPGYGCCYLTEHNSDLEAAFEVGKEVLSYRSMWEAAEQIKRVNREPNLAVRIGMAARRRVLATHTWETRLRQISERL